MSSSRSWRSSHATGRTPLSDVGDERRALDTSVGQASEGLLDAVRFAVDAHGRVRQARKGTAFPYVIHPLRVGEILYRHGADEDVVRAGLLHDTIEDARVSAQELAERFGPRVADLVLGVSEPDKSAPWRVRKEHTIASVRTAPDDVLHVLAADKVDNVRSIKESLAERGDETWAIFNAGEDDQRWYYRELTHAFLERDADDELFKTLQVEVETVFPTEPDPDR
jgi:(p)ppGpp synthase/HD superfamily hydrolase